jgi:hypothetical protein
LIVNAGNAPKSAKLVVNLPASTDIIDAPAEIVGGEVVTPKKVAKAWCFEVQGSNSAMFDADYNLNTPRGTSKVIVFMEAVSANAFKPNNFADYLTRSTDDTSPRGAEDDADGDGLSNLMEYTFNLPSDKPSALPIGITYTGRPGATKPSFTFRQYAGLVSRVVITVEASSSLLEGSWRPVATGASFEDLRILNDADIVITNSAPIADRNPDAFASEQFYRNVTIAPTDPTRGPQFYRLRIEPLEEDLLDFTAPLFP